MARAGAQATAKEAAGLTFPIENLKRAYRYKAPRPTVVTRRPGLATTHLAPARHDRPDSYQKN
jgi:hypothetical protein